MRGTTVYTQTFFVLEFLSTGNTGVGVCNCEIACSEQEWSVQTTFSQMMEAAISRQLSSGTKAALTTAFNNAKTASTNTGAPGLPTSLSYRYASLQYLHGLIIYIKHH